MTKQEVQRLLLIIASQYPTFKPNKLEFITDAWHMELEPYSSQEAEMALRVYNSTNNTSFAPSIGQILTGINRLKMPDSEMSEGEAWSMIYKAISNANYHASDEFEKLPPVLQKVVGSPEMLRTWAMSDMDDVQTVIQSNCMRSFKQVNKREFDRASIPDNVKTLIGIATGNKRIEKIESWKDKVQKQL